MFVLDTNVYAANVDCPEHPACRSLIEKCRRESLPWYLTWPIIYEFLQVVSHPSLLQHPWSLQEAWNFVAALTASPGMGFLVETQRHQAVASRTFAELPDLAGTLFQGGHTAVLMREHGVAQIYTRDTHFHRFPFLQVLDPLRKRPGL